MSISEPATPAHHESDLLLISSFDDKWAAVSCGNVDRLDSKTDEADPSPICKARWKALRVKRENIASFLKKHNDNLHDYIDELRHFASTPGGLVSDDFRAIIWPVLAAHLIPSDDSNDSDSDFESALSQISEDHGFDDCESNEGISSIKDEEANLRLHPEWNQVELDVHRTLARFPPNISENHRTTLQQELIPLIVRVLSSDSRFRYYQGFHDICLTILLVCGVDGAYNVCLDLARNGAFRDYLVKTLEQSVLKQLDLMYVILSRVEPGLERLMRGVELGSIFALSWPLTWFSHSLHQYPQIVRFFDVFLAQPPLCPVYVASAIVVSRRAEIVTCEREMPFIHRLLTEMPHEIPLDAILSDALYMARLLPPCMLKGRLLDEYRTQINQAPVQPRLASAIPRYALQLVFVAGTVSAAAGYLFMSKYGL